MMFRITNLCLTVELLQLKPTFSDFFSSEFHHLVRCVSGIVPGLWPLCFALVLYFFFFFFFLTIHQQAKSFSLTGSSHHCSQSFFREGTENHVIKCVVFVKMTQPDLWPLTFLQVYPQTLPHPLPRWWRCLWKSAFANATLWKRCSSSPRRPFTTPVGSSERESPRLRLDRVRGPLLIYIRIRKNMTFLLVWLVLRLVFRSQKCILYCLWPQEGAIYTRDNWSPILQ